MSYSIPILVLALIVGTTAITFFVVSRRSAAPDGKRTPFAHDDATPLGATDEGSDAPPSEQRSA